MQSMVARGSPEHRRSSMAASDTGPIFIYVGTYTQSLPHVQAKAVGIYVYSMEADGGDWKLVQAVPDVPNPSYLALHPSRRFLYAVNEVGALDGERGGAVSAFAVDPASGKLTYLNRRSTHGEDPCHLTVEPSGRHVLAANYSGGSIAAFRILEDGSVSASTDFHQHVGKSVNPARQNEPHAHSINVDPTGRFALVCDLGQDRVIVYQLDLDAGKLTPHSWVASEPGVGPRHLDFHPNGRNAYVIDEIGNTMTAYSWNGAAGKLDEIQRISTLPEGAEVQNNTADVHVHPSGRFVYGSNRGHDSIGAFAIDGATGKLTPLGHESTLGGTPRNFAIGLSGGYLYAANQSTDTVTVYRIDEGSGLLAHTGQQFDVPTPVCLKMTRLG
jgi:6-phosphogluconolactonase